MYDDYTLYEDNYNRYAHRERLRQQIMQEYIDSMHCPFTEPIKKETKPNLNLL